MDRIIEIKVNGNHLTKDNTYAGVQGEANVTFLRIVFDKGWDGFAKKVVFWNARGQNPVERTLTTDMLDSEGAYLCPIPGEPLEFDGEFDFVIDGSMSGKAQKTVGDRLKVKYSPNANGAGNAVDPTPDQVEQLQGEIEAIKTDIVRAGQAADAKEAAEASAQRAEEAASTVDGIVERATEKAQEASYSADRANDASMISQSAMGVATSAADDAERAKEAATQKAQEASNSAAGALGSANAAKSSEDNAKASENEAKKSEEESKTSASEAKTAEEGAKKAAEEVETAKNEAVQAKEAAEGFAQTAMNAVDTVAEYENSAANHANNAILSAGAAGASELNAKESEEKAAGSEQNAKTHEEGALAARQGIEESLAAAQKSALEASASETAAKEAQSVAEKARDDAQNTVKDVVKKSGDTMTGDLKLQPEGIGGYSKVKKNANADGDYGLQLQDYSADGAYMGLTLSAESQKMELKMKAAGETSYKYPEIYHSENPQAGVYGDYPQFELMASDNHGTMIGKSADASNDYGTVIRDTNGSEKVEFKLRADNKQARLCYVGKEYAMYHEGNLDLEGIYQEISVERARINSFTALGAGSTTGDAELIDARVDCEGRTWTNVGDHVRGISRKIIDACFDKEIIGEGGNYNLLKLSEVSYSSRLQDDVAGIVDSTAPNVVTGWIPVQYGKFYTPSILYNGIRIAGSTTFNLVRRINLKLSDGTVVVYSGTDITTAATSPVVDYTSNNTIKILYENATEMMVHLFIVSSDISTAEKFEVYEPMIVEGDSIKEAYNKSLNSEYINGEVYVPAEYEFTLKHDETKADKVPISPYIRDVNFGLLPCSYYRGVADSYENSAFGWTTQYADFIGMWKALVANHTSYVTETALGSASDGQTVYLYDFKPVRITNQDKPIPKVIIIAGQHGGETANIFGLYYFVSDLLNKWNKHPALEYLRNHVELMIVPVLNTYGFDNRSYKNANGVNLNRNYDSNWALVADTSSNQYGGSEPFDQPETQIVRDLLLNNTDAVLVIDSHVNGGGKVANYSDINYYGISTSTDAYFNRMVDAVAHNLSAISANFNLDYELGQPDTMMGFLNHSDGVGILRNWGRDQNFVTVLVEGFGGFPNRTAFTAEVFKANEEIMVNWLITAMNYLGK